MRSIFIFVLIVFTPLFGEEGFVNGDRYFLNDGNKVHFKELKNEALKKDEGFSIRSLDENLKWYEDQDGDIVATNGKVMIFIKDASVKDEIIDRYSLDVEEVFFGDILLIRTDEDVFSLANRLYEDEDIEISQPNFIHKAVVR